MQLLHSVAVKFLKRQTGSGSTAWFSHIQKQESPRGFG